MCLACKTDKPVPGKEKEVGDEDKHAGHDQDVAEGDGAEQRVDGGTHRRTCQHDHSDDVHCGS